MHSHPHGDSHHHAHAATGVLSAALVATLCLVAAEFAGGHWAHSLALTGDAVHNLSDVPGILISWIAAQLAERPADTKRTFGYRRAGILAAFTNSILLQLVALGLMWEALLRFWNPVPVHEQWMISLSLVALAVNGAITLGLVRQRHDLNMKALVVHNFGDALSNVGILAAAVLIRFTGALWLDPALGVVIGGLILWSSWGIFRESGHVLLEGSPRQMQLPDIAAAVLRISGAQEVHDIHVWTLDGEHHALSCHVRIPDMHMDESEKILGCICECLKQEFGIDHATIQFERAGLPGSGYYMPEPFRSTKA